MILQEEVEVRTILVKLKCPCGGGVRKIAHDNMWGGIGAMTSRVTYKCDTCGKSETLDHEIPTLRYEQVVRP